MVFSKCFSSKAKRSIIPLDPTTGFAGCRALMMLCLLGIVGVLMVVSYVRNAEPPAVVITPAVATLPADFCMVCHGPRNEPPKIKGHSGYKKKFPSPAEKRDNRPLEDLKAVLSEG